MTDLACYTRMPFPVKAPSLLCHPLHTDWVTASTHCRLHADFLPLVADGVQLNAGQLTVDVFLFPAARVAHCRYFDIFPLTASRLAPSVEQGTEAETTQAKILLTTHCRHFLLHCFCCRQFGKPEATRIFNEYPWSPRWPPHAMASRIIGFLREAVPAFLGVGVGPQVVAPPSTGTGGGPSAVALASAVPLPAPESYRL